MISRTNNVSLPRRAELDLILKTESTFAVPPSKTKKHYVDFTPMIELLNELGVDTSLFTNESLNIYEAVEDGNKLLQTIVETIKKRPLQELIPYFNAIYQYLSEQDDPQPSDLIFVFGGKSLFRPQKAAELFHKGLAPLIVVSGAHAIYDQQAQQTEATIYKNILIENHVPVETILLEDKAITTADNVRRSLALFKKRNMHPKRIILINSPHAQRRGWAHFKKFSPDSTTLYRVNAKVIESFLQGNWYRQEDTLRIVLNEYIKLRASVIYNTA